MARITVTVTASERIALEAYKHLSRVVAEAAERPPWDREMDLEDLAEIMKELRAVAESGDPEEGP